MSFLIDINGALNIHILHYHPTHSVRFTRPKGIVRYETKQMGSPFDPGRDDEDDEDF
jgi:hypothetical protein